MIVGNLYFWAYPKIRSRMGQNRRQSDVRFRSLASNLHQAYDPKGTILHFSERTRCRLYFWPEGIERRLGIIRKKYQHAHCHVEEGDLVFDVGANIGEFSIAVAQTASRIFSFDPDPNCWPALNANAAMHDSITPLCEGLGKDIGETTFYIASRTADSSFIKPERFDATVSVPITTLEKKLQQLSTGKVDFLKLEAEGFEPEILEGAATMLPLFKKVAVDVSPERHGKSPKAHVTSILRDSGFDVWGAGNVIFAKQKERF